MNFTEIQEEQRAAIDKAGAAQRLEQYAATQGLLPNDHNFLAIQDWIVANAKGYWSAAGVDAAITAINIGTDTLQWASRAAPVAAAPTEHLRKLDDGTTQLPLDTTPGKQHSSAQLKDWLKRTSAATNHRLHRPSGSFSSRF